MISAGQVVSMAQRAIEEEWGYVWGGQGQLYSAELAAKWGAAKRSGKSKEYYVNTCAKWFGHIVVDCSGLLVECMRSYDDEYGDRGSLTFYKQGTEKGPISSIPNIPGLGLWKPGHVGLYIGDGKIIEARGVAYGVVETTVAGRDFTQWFKIANVDYNESYELPEDSSEEAFRLNRYLRYEPMSGTDIAAVQAALEQAGYDPGPIDGKYGQLTAEAVRQFQIEHKLRVDCIVGEQTTDALGGIWTL